MSFVLLQPISSTFFGFQIHIDLLIQPLMIRFLLIYIYNCYGALYRLHIVATVASLAALTEIATFFAVDSTVCHIIRELIFSQMSQDRS